MVVVASSATKQAYAALWSWEKKWLKIDELCLTGMPARYLWFTTFVFFALFVGIAAVFSPTLSLNFLLFPFFARLAALDVHFRVLPNVYVVPSLLMVIAIEILGDNYIMMPLGIVLAVAILLIMWGTSKFIVRKNSTMGGGDAKLMIVLGALLGPEMLPFCLLASAVITLPFFAIWPKRGVPFGPALLLSGVVFTFI
jgi:prepilin signal peptidase PulO-like enzyme (type II secretory pathway)